MSENLRVIRFAVIVCLACSALVSAAAIGLRERQEENLRLDIRKNILKSVGLWEPGMSAESVNAVFDEHMVGLVLTPEGKVVEGRKPEDLAPDRPEDARLLTLYRCEKDGRVMGYTFPVVGKGLWSTIYGYLALEPDLNTVKGITFYKHGETPGLGGEIEKPWFQRNFVGKKILDEEGRIASITVVKGKAAQKHPEDLGHYVDGISGATITSKGVTRMLRDTLTKYESYFGRIRQGGTT